MADIVNDLVFAFSGNVAYSDGSNSTIECYYDSKAGAYTVDGAEGLNTDAQLQHSVGAPGDYGITTQAGSWYQELQWFFLTALATATGPSQSITRVGGNPATPSPLKTIVDYALHVRGTISFEDGDHFPVSGTWTKMALPGGGASHVDEATNQHFVDNAWESADEWTDAIESAFQLVILNTQIA
jgi:hypothetical protein